MEENLLEMKENFQVQIKKEIEHREEMAEQLQLVRETLCKELDEERKFRFSLQQKLKDAHEALQHFSVRVLGPSGQQVAAAAPAVAAAAAAASAAPTDYSVRPSNNNASKEASGPGQQQQQQPTISAAATTASSTAAANSKPNTSPSSTGITDATISAAAPSSVTVPE